MLSETNFIDQSKQQILWLVFLFKLLKLAKDIIAPVISEIFNTSIKLGTHPSKLKMSKFTPIFKSDGEADAKNYRPISLLSNYNTIFEKIMYK